MVLDGNDYPSIDIVENAEDTARSILNEAPISFLLVLQKHSIQREEEHLLALKTPVVV